MQDPIPQPQEEEEMEEEEKVWLLGLLSPATCTGGCVILTVCLSPSPAQEPRYQASMVCLRAVGVASSESQGPCFSLLTYQLDPGKGPKF